jgi:hypothetical protein
VRCRLSLGLCSHKTLCDASFSNQSWTIVSRGMFTLKEVNQMEREMLDYLGWDLAMDRRELNRITVSSSFFPISHHLVRGWQVGGGDCASNFEPLSASH